MINQPITIKTNNNHDFPAHQEIFQQWSEYFISKAMPGSWLIIGPKNVGKYFFARRIADVILSHKLNSAITFSDSHPDLLVLKSNKDSQIMVDEVRNLHQFIRLSPLISQFKVVIIDNSDDLNINAANALLKMLEEPRNTIFFLISSNLSKIPSTIISRSRKIKLPRLNLEEAINISKAIRPDIEPSILSEVLILADYSPFFAVQLYDLNIMEIYRKLLDLISDPQILEIKEVINLYDMIEGEKLWAIFSLLIQRFLLQVIKYDFNISVMIGKEKQVLESLDQINKQSLLMIFDKIEHLLKETASAYLDQKQVFLLILQLLQQMFSSKDLKNE